MTKVGIAGIGFMGWIHWLAYQKVAGIEVAAICTRSESKRNGDWTGIKGNFGPPGEQVDLSGIQCYADYDQLLADDSLDVIDVCLPPDRHANESIQALSAGKHVFCEKPMALTAADCERVVAAGEEAGKQVLIGHVLPLFPEYAWALAACRDGRYGKVLGGNFKRVISDPSQAWLPDFFNPDTIGGPVVDLHVHDAHFIRLLFGMPTAVASQGRLREDVVEYFNTQFTFTDPSLVVSATGGVIGQQGRSFTHGFEIHLERATLQYEFAVVGEDAVSLMPLTVFDDTGQATRPDIGDGDPLAAFVKEIGEVATAVSSGQPSQLLSGDLARDAIVLCHKQTESVRRRAAVSV